MKTLWTRLDFTDFKNLPYRLLLYNGRLVGLGARICPRLLQIGSESELETGRVDRHRSGCRSGRDSSTGRSSRLKNRSNSPFWQLKDI